MNDVGEPCAREPHARFDAAAGGNQDQSGQHAPRGRGSLPPTLQNVTIGAWGPANGDWRAREAWGSGASVEEGLLRSTTMVSPFRSQLGAEP